MRLTELHLTRVRHFPDNTVIKFCEDMTALVGPNGSGKSSVFDVLAFLLAGHVPSDFGADADDSSGAEVDGVFADSKASDIRFRATVDKRGRRELRVLMPVPRDLQGGLDSTKAELQAFLGESPSGASKADLQQLAQKKLATLGPDAFETEWVPASENMRAALPRLTRISAEALVDVKKAVEEVITRSFQSFIEEHHAEWQRWNELFASFAEKDLQTISENVRDQCSDILQDFVVSASVNTAKTKIDTEVGAERAHGKVLVDDLSLGQRRRLALAVADALTERLGERGSEIVVYDEPDAHLDNDAQVRLQKVLREQAAVAGVQVAVATHSPRLINEFDSVNIVHLVPHEETSLVVRNFMDLIGEDDVDLLADLDDSLGNTSLLHDRLVLVCEGKSEHAAIPLLFRALHGRTLSSMGIKLTWRHGSGDARRFAEMLWKVRPGKVMLLLDADQRKPADEACNDGGIQPAFVGTREIEDCFPDEVWAEALARLAEEEARDVVVTAEEIAEMRTHPKAGLSKRMDDWLGTHRMQISKPDRIRRAAECCDPTTVHESLISALKQAYAMADGSWER